MDDPLNPLAFPVMLRAPDWLPPQAQADGRLPFAMLVVALLQPAQVVELGVGCGQTYAALCQAVQALALAGQCLGVELDDSLPAEFRAHHAAHYGGFSRLVAAPAPGPAAFFADGSVDLLHLAAGLTSAQAAAAFREWQPKLSARAAVLVSRIHPAEGTDGAQGLAAFWAETGPAYSRFELSPGQGPSLGLLLAGAQPPAALAALTRLPAEQQAALRELIYRLGQAAAASSAGAAGLLADRQAQITMLNQTLREQTEHLGQLQGRLEIVTAREREIRGLYLDLHQQLAERDDIGEEVIQRDRIIATHDAILFERNEHIAWMGRDDLRKQQEAAAESDRQLAARDEALTRLRIDLALAQAEIRTIHAGRIWRLSLVYWKIRARFLSLFR